MNPQAIEDELRALKTDAILAPNKPLTRLAIYKWLDQHDIHIHSDYVVKLDNLIQAIHAENLAAHTAQAVKLAEVEAKLNELADIREQEELSLVRSSDGTGAAIVTDVLFDSTISNRLAELESQRQALISNKDDNTHEEGR